MTSHEPASVSTRADATWEAFARHGWRGHVRRGWRRLVDGDPTRLLDAAQARVARQRPTARTVALELEEGGIYLSHRTALKDHDPGGATAVNRLRWRFGRSRARAVWSISGRLAEQGFLVPEVLLVARRTRGLELEELLATRDTGTRQVHFELLEGSAQRQRELFDRIGRRVAELHAKGFVHGDLSPGNLLITPDGGDVIFIDNDRTRRPPLGVPWRSRRRNLVQFLARSRLLWSWRRIRAFVDAYDAVSARPPSRRRWLEVFRAVRRRHRALASDYARRRAAESGDDATPAKGCSRDD